MKTYVENKYIVSEELLGFGNEFLNKHQTEIKNPETRKHIASLSIQEIIN